MSNTMCNRHIKINFLRAIVLLLFCLIGLISIEPQVALSLEPHNGHEHEDEGHHEERDSHPLRRSHDELKEFGIRVMEAGPMPIMKTISLTGEVRLNMDRVANVVSIVPGVIVEVKKFIGDTVKKGEVMAVIQSRELAEMKSNYLASKERLSLSRIAFERERLLWEKKINSQQDFL